MEELVHLLTRAVNEEMSITHERDTLEIEGNSFFLALGTGEGKVLVIRNIEARTNNGTGRTIIAALHEYADMLDLDVVASKVRDTAQGFWEKMGYQQGSDGEYFRMT